MAIKGFKKYLLGGTIALATLLAAPNCAANTAYSQEKDSQKQEQKADDAKQTESPKEQTLEQKIGNLEAAIKKEPKNEWNFYELGQIYFDEATKFYTGLPKETKDKWEEQKKNETEPYKKWKSTIDKGDEIFLKGVDIDMKKESVEDILKDAPSNVEFVKYDEKSKTTNFDELVYQESKKPEERKPVLVMFYHNKDPPGTKSESIGVGHREAIVFKNLANKYGKDLECIAYELSIDPDFYNSGRLRSEYNIKTPPSIAAYSLFDVTKGETAKKNDCKIKQIDILRGGPKGDREISALYRDCINPEDGWVTTNIVSSNGKYVWRLNNTLPWKWDKIIFNK